MRSERRGIYREVSGVVAASDLGHIGLPRAYLKGHRSRYLAHLRGPRFSGKPPELCDLMRLPEISKDS